MFERLFASRFTTPARNEFDFEIALPQTATYLATQAAPDLYQRSSDSLFNARAWQPADNAAPLISADEIETSLFMRCGCSSCAKADRNLDPDAPQSTGLLDAHGDTIATASSITVDGAHIIASIDALGDQDFFAVTLVEGQWYNIGQYLTPGGPSLIPLADAYIELYDNAGNLITSADGGGPNTPSGLDALLTYQADYTGTYYINARAFDQDATNGSTGDHVGDYELFVDSSVESPTTYRPFYDTSSPLHSLDWGSQIDRTSRNPDGDNGTRPNPLAPDGNGPILTNNYGIEGKNVVTYYFAKQGDVFLDEEAGGLATMIQAQNMFQWEKDAFRQALDLYEQVADVIYLEVDNRNEADFKFITYQGTPGVGASLLGRMSPPNEANEGQMEINRGDVRWTEEGVQQGGFYFPTLIHELGHGHGLSHPHDNGGRSSIMPGADGGTGGLGGGFGDWGLSQQVFTIMSYNDGWTPDAPYNAAPVGHGGPRSGGLTGTEVDHFGWQGTLAALDIAVIQDKYGVNEEWARGNDVYEIKDFNGAGNFYQTIWDGGGTDEIRYSGSADATIDLRAATLQYEQGGGGRVSFAMGLWGGFTIANGVTIEKATGGQGDDALIGNAVANTLAGGLGDDTLQGMEGNDVLEGYSGADAIDGGAGRDEAIYTRSDAGITVRLDGSVSSGGHAQGDTLTSIEGVRGSAFNDRITGSADANTLRGGDGVDYIEGLAGADVLDGGNGRDELGYAQSNGAVVVDLGTGVVSGGHAAGDRISGFEGVRGSAFADTLRGSADGNTLTGLNGNDTLEGLGGADYLVGGFGADRLIGGAGNDTLSGGDGADRFVFSGASGYDNITDFAAGLLGSDVIELDSSIFTSFADVLAHATDSLAGLVISKGGVTIRLQGVLEAQLDVGDFSFVSPVLLMAEKSSDLISDDPLVLPASAGPEQKTWAEPTQLDWDDPLILPAGLEDKMVAEAEPEVCRPNGEVVSVTSEYDLMEIGLSSFDGRDPHRFLLEPRSLDWIV